MAEPWSAPVLRACLPAVRGQLRPCSRAMAQRPCCNKQPEVGTPGPQEAGGLTCFWDLVPYLAHRASFPLFCFRPTPPCPWAAASMYRAKAGLQRCCPCPALAPATCLACSAAAGGLLLKEVTTQGLVDPVDLRFVSCRMLFFCLARLNTGHCKTKKSKSETRS